MVMKDLCEKIHWEKTRQLENGDVVPTGCDGKLTTLAKSLNLLFFQFIYSHGKYFLSWY